MPKARAPLRHDRGEANSCSAGHKSGERESIRRSHTLPMILTFDETSWYEVKYIERRDLWCTLRVCNTLPTCGECERLEMRG